MKSNPKDFFKNGRESKAISSSCDGGGEKWVTFPWPNLRTFATLWRSRTLQNGQFECGHKDNFNLKASAKRCVSF